MTQENTALPKQPDPGYKRAWKYCRQHNRYGYYDYVPYSLSNPISVMPCSCDTKSCKTVPEDEAIAALSSPAQSSGVAFDGEGYGWRPIETAPKDGSQILAIGWDFGNAEGKRHYAIVLWNDCWYSHYEDEALEYLTHWMHLPADLSSATPTTDSLTADAVETAKAIWVSFKRAFLKDAGPDLDAIGETIAIPHIRAMPLPAQTVPADVAALVVAAREALWGASATMEQLEAAVEVFAPRVCWDDEGGSLPDAHAAPCSCGKGGK